MSYEGYEEFLCENGHYFTLPEFFCGGEIKCEYCGGSEVWSNEVDETNGEGFCFGPDRLRMKTEAEYYECQDPKCGHKTLIKPATYDTPTIEEMAEFELEMEKVS